MSTSVPNFNFLALLILEIYWGSQNKNWDADLPKRPLADKFLYGALVLVNAYKCAKLHSSISYGDIEEIPKFNAGLVAPWRTLYAEMYLARSNSLPNFSIISLCTMQLCEYVFPIGFPRTQNGIFGGFEGEEVKIMCSNPR